MTTNDNINRLDQLESQSIQIMPPAVFMADPGSSPSTNRIYDFRGTLNSP